MLSISNFHPNVQRSLLKGIPQCRRLVIDDPVPIPPSTETTAKPQSIPPAASDTESPGKKLAEQRTAA